MITEYKGRTPMLGEKAKVYFNLHKLVFSIKLTLKVVKKQEGGT